MFKNMTPQQYENFWRRTVDLITNLISSSFLAFFIFLIATIIASRSYDIVVMNYFWYFSISSFLISLFVVYFISAVKRFGLFSHPIIYWWVIVFGHCEDMNRLFKRSANNSTFIRSSWYKSDFERADKILKEHAVGLYYFDKTRDDFPIVYFADKSAAMKLILSRPESGFKLD